MVGIVNGHSPKRNDNPEKQDYVPSAITFLQKQEVWRKKAEANYIAEQIIGKLLDKFPDLDAHEAFKLLGQHFINRVPSDLQWTDKEWMHKIEWIKNHPGLWKGEYQGHCLARIACSVVERKIQWLWPGWIPLAKLTLLDGDPGLGKSTMLLDLAARVTKLGNMPDGSEGFSGNVCIMSAEDSADDTVVPRLKAAKFNSTRTVLFDEIQDQYGEVRPIEILGQPPWLWSLFFPSVTIPETVVHYPGIVI